jgi:hypothetical protein
VLSLQNEVVRLEMLVSEIARRDDGVVAPQPAVASAMIFSED